MEPKYLKFIEIDEDNKDIICEISLTDLAKERIFVHEKRVVNYVETGEGKGILLIMTAASSERILDDGTFIYYAIISSILYTKVSEGYRKFIVFDMSDCTAKYVDDIKDNSNKSETKTILLVSRISDEAVKKVVKKIKEREEKIS